MSIRKILLGVALSAVVPSLSFAADDAKPSPGATPPAQPQPSSGRPRFSPAERIASYRDQFEGVDLTDDQMKKIDKFLDAAEAEVKKAPATEDRESRRAQFEVLRKLDEDVQSVLTDTQKAKLRSKQNQEFIDRAFKSQFDNDKVNLTADQKTKLASITSDLKTQMDANNGGDRRESMRKNFPLMMAAREKMMAVLTDDQKKAIPNFGFGRRGGQPQNPAPAPAPQGN